MASHQLHYFLEQIIPRVMYGIYVQESLAAIQNNLHFLKSIYYVTFCQ